MLHWLNIWLQQFLQHNFFFLHKVCTLSCVIETFSNDLSLRAICSFIIKLYMAWGWSSSMHFQSSHNECTHTPSVFHPLLSLPLWIWSSNRQPIESWCLIDFCPYQSWENKSPSVDRVSDGKTSCTWCMLYARCKVGQNLTKLALCRPHPHTRSTAMCVHTSNALPCKPGANLNSTGHTILQGRASASWGRGISLTDDYWRHFVSGRN